MINTGSMSEFSLAAKALDQSIQFKRSSSTMGLHPQGPNDGKNFIFESARSVFSSSTALI